MCTRGVTPRNHGEEHKHLRRDPCDQQGVAARKLFLSCWENVGQQTMSIETERLLCTTFPSKSCIKECNDSLQSGREVRERNSKNSIQNTLH